MAGDHFECVEPGVALVTGCNELLAWAVVKPPSYAAATNLSITTISVYDAGNVQVPTFEGTERRFIDWGDGTYDQVSSRNLTLGSANLDYVSTHVYASAGAYNVKYLLRYADTGNDPVALGYDTDPYDLRWDVAEDFFAVSTTVGTTRTPTAHFTSPDYLTGAVQTVNENAYYEAWRPALYPFSIPLSSVRTGELTRTGGPLNAPIGQALFGDPSYSQGWKVTDAFGTSDGLYGQYDGSIMDTPNFAYDEVRQAVLDGSSTVLWDKDRDYDERPLGPLPSGRYLDADYADPINGTQVLLTRVDSGTGVVVDEVEMDPGFIPRLYNVLGMINSRELLIVSTMFTAGVGANHWWIYDIETGEHFIVLRETDLPADVELAQEDTLRTAYSGRANGGFWAKGTMPGPTVTGATDDVSVIVGYGRDGALEAGPWVVPGWTTVSSGGRYLQAASDFPDLGERAFTADFCGDPLNQNTVYIKTMGEPYADKRRTWGGSDYVTSPWPGGYSTFGYYLVTTDIWRMTTSEPALVASFEYPCWGWESEDGTSALAPEMQATTLTWGYVEHTGGVYECPVTEEVEDWEMPEWTWDYTGIADVGYPENPDPEITRVYLRPTRAIARARAELLLPMGNPFNAPDYDDPWAAEGGDGTTIPDGMGIRQERWSYLEVGEHITVRGQAIAKPQMIAVSRSSVGVTLPTSEVRPDTLTGSLGMDYRWVASAGAVTGPWLPLTGTLEIAPTAPPVYIPALTYELGNGRTLTRPALQFDGTAYMRLPNRLTAQASFAMVARLHSSQASFAGLLEHTALYTETFDFMRFALRHRQSSIEVHEPMRVIDHDLADLVNGPATPIVVCLSLNMATRVGHLLVQGRGRITRSFALPSDRPAISWDMWLGTSVAAENLDHTEEMDLFEFHAHDQALSLAELSQVASRLDSLYGCTG